MNRGSEKCQQEKNAKKQLKWLKRKIEGKQVGSGNKEEVIKEGKRIKEGKLQHKRDKDVEKREKRKRHKVEKEGCSKSEEVRLVRDKKRVSQVSKRQKARKLSS